MRVFKYKLEISDLNLKGLTSKSILESNHFESKIYDGKNLNIIVSRVYTIKGWDKDYTKRVISFIRKINGKEINFCIEIPINNWIFEKIFNHKKAIFYKTLVLCDKSYFKTKITKNTTTNKDNDWINQVIYTVPDGKTPESYIYLPYYCGDKID